MESWAFWWTVLTAAVVGSAHCAGMCGPLAVVAGGCQGGSARWSCLAAYQTGRLVSYLVLGLIAGIVGATLNLGGASLGWQQTAAYVAGGSLIAMGLVSLAARWSVVVRRWTTTTQHLPKWLQVGLSRVRQRMSGWSPLKRAWVLGGLSGALPCGWLYGFVLIAAGTGGLGSGMAVMALLWLGSVPVLLGIAWAATWLLQRFARQATWATAVLMVVVGSLLVAQRTGWAFDRAVPNLSASESAAEEQVQSLSTAVPECCRDAH